MLHCATARTSGPGKEITRKEIIYKETNSRTINGNIKTVGKICDVRNQTGLLGAELSINKMKWTNS